MSEIAFSPIGNTVVVAADTTAPTGVQVPSANLGVLPGQYRIINTSSNTVFLGVGATAAAATANAVEPIAGTSSSAIVLVAGAVEVFSLGGSAFFSALAIAPSTLYISPGAGL